MLARAGLWPTHRHTHGLVIFTIDAQEQGRKFALPARLAKVPEFVERDMLPW